MIKCVASCLLSGLLLLVNIHRLNAQEYIYKHYDLQDGLANLTIHSIFQDKDGFLWIGTESGLCRYDGTQFKTFTVKDGLPGNDVFYIFQDSRDRLWLQLYNNSIAYIYKGKVYNQENDSLLKKIHLASRVYGITENSEGDIAICDIGTVFILSPVSGRLKMLHLENDAKDGIVSLNVNREKELVVCTSTSLYKITNNGFSLLRRIIPDTKNYRIGPAEVLLHPSYIVTGCQGKRDVYLKDTVLHFYVTDFSMKITAVSDTVFSLNTMDGAYLFNIQNQHLVKVLAGYKVSNTYLDRENNLWIGTISKGLFKLSSRAIVNSKISEQQNDIFYITKDNNKIIAGNNVMEVFEYGGRFTKRHKRGKGGYFVRKVYYYKKLPDEKYFMAHEMGLINYRKDKIINEIVIHMLKQVSPVNEDYTLTASNNGIHLVRNDDLKIIDTIWNRKSLSVLKTGDSLLVGTLTGLFVLRKSFGRYTVTDSLLPNSIINIIQKAANQTIWISTFGEGLYCYRDGKLLNHFTDSFGLPSNITRSLFINKNDVWLGTDKGLIKITSYKGDYTITKYSTSDGLPSNTINSIFVDSNMVYIGTPEGLCHFDERKINSTSICNLVVTGIKIGDQAVDISNRYVLKGNQRLSIDFSGISFRSEQEMMYRYMIKGLDDDWQYTNRNSLEFAALPYGDYTLEIVAINKQDKESQPVRLSFYVKKPFYKTAWFMVLVVLLPVSGILIYNDRRLNLARKKQLQKLQQEIKMLELEQMALRLQMNPHFIFNCISTIQQLVEENDTGNTTRFINSFSGLVRQTLDNAPELLIPLEEEIKFLNNYFELERIRLEDRFSYSIHTYGINHGEQLLVPNMVIQPFVENAIRHGIRYKKDGQGKVEVRFVQQEALLRCTITDNGIGRQRAEELREELGILHKPQSMGITFKRIQSLNTLTHRNIRIEIEDLKDENYNASGTKVIIEFYKAEHDDKNRYN